MKRVAVAVLIVLTGWFTWNRVISGLGFKRSISDERSTRATMLEQEVPTTSETASDDSSNGPERAPTMTDGSVESSQTSEAATQRARAEFENLEREHLHGRELLAEDRTLIFPSGTEVQRKWDDQIEVLKERTDDGSTVLYRVRLDGGIESEMYRRWTGEEVLRTYDKQGGLRLLMRRTENGTVHFYEYFESGRLQREVTEVGGNVFTIEYDEAGKMLSKRGDIDGHTVEQVTSVGD